QGKGTTRHQRKNRPRQVQLCILLLVVCDAFGQVSYTVPEEMAKGTLVGNIAQDLGLDIKRLKLGNARVYSGDSREYVELNAERGLLLLKGKTGALKSASLQSSVLNSC
uniref:Cadherin N-terminal domain-containing protein n=1 Tax=Neolamprologus brichardi TaxID=32507 RepID=A0A3Q4GMD8_NEOBR